MKMKVAVINEVSARDKNQDIIRALEKTGVQVLNVGMSEENQDIELTYIHTGLMAGILLNLGAVDLVVGGCGTGQGFLVSAMQYPNVFGGLIKEPLDAWLFSQINGGNLVSLELNKGYGWAGEINLLYIFEKLFKDPMGQGFPAHRAQSQAQSRGVLKDISAACHKPFEEILSALEKSIVERVFAFKPFVQAVKGPCRNKDLQSFIIKKFLVKDE
ncbi:MAG: RpiB/LacA/LacB family sugar-phosphate isomerase [Christensenellales bacterium]